MTPLEPSTAASATILHRLRDAYQLEVGASISFEIQGHDWSERAFVLALPGRLVAYINRCPHWLVDLDMGDQRFYTAKEHRIYCKTHGALFIPETGECDSGPCYGARLEKLRVQREGDDAIVSYTPPGVDD